MGCKASKTTMVSEPQEQRPAAKTLLQDATPESKPVQPKQLVTVAQNSVDDAPADQAMVDATTENAEMDKAVAVHSLTEPLEHKAVAVDLVAEPLVAEVPSADQPIVDSLTQNAEEGKAVGVTSVAEGLATEVVLEDKVVKLECCCVEESKADSAMFQEPEAEDGKVMKLECCQVEEDKAGTVAQEPEVEDGKTVKLECCQVQESKADSAVAQEPDPVDGIIGVSNEAAFETPAEQPIADAVTACLEEDQVVVSSCIVTMGLEEDQVIQQCPNGHPLDDYVKHSGGRCDHCGIRVSNCQHVLACKDCNWLLCDSCSKIKAIDGEVSMVAMDSPTSVSQQAACL